MYGLRVWYSYVYVSLVGVRYSCFISIRYIKIHHLHQEELFNENDVLLQILFGEVSVETDSGDSETYTYSLKRKIAGMFVAKCRLIKHSNLLSSVSSFL